MADSDWVLVPRVLLEDALRDLQSPFPREVQVVADLGLGDTSIERLQAVLASPAPEGGEEEGLGSASASGDDGAVSFAAANHEAAHSAGEAASPWRPIETASEHGVAYKALGIALAALQHIQGMEPITQEITLPTVMAQHAVDALKEIEALGATSCPNPCGECRGVVRAGKCGVCGWEPCREMDPHHHQPDPDSRGDRASPDRGVPEGDRAMKDLLTEIAEGAVSPWRPIETAPKDGTEIILRRGARVGCAAWYEWQKRASEYHSNGTYLGEFVTDEGASWSIGLDGDGWDGDKAPTHWMPLPEPPTPTSQEAGHE